MRRLLLALALVVSSTVPRAAHAAEAADLLARINALRTANGEVALTADRRLGVIAANWVARLAASGHLNHNMGLPGELSATIATWGVASENVGVGPSPDWLETHFEASAEHRAAMLNPAFRFAGVGTVWAGSRLWADEIFIIGPTAPTGPVSTPAQPVLPVEVGTTSVGSETGVWQGPFAAVLEQLRAADGWPLRQ